jgi:tetratricopeptide (TPR) repeat protein
MCIVLAACGSKSDAPAKQGASGSAAPATDAAATSDAAVPASKPPRAAKPVTAEQRAAYKAKMKSGWALAKKKKWAEAVTAFEGAVKAIDGDQRALAELGFAAMSAGDFTKARRADEQAVQVASDKKVKAAALYNLGLLLEKTNDKDGALRAYHTSLQLRPNKTVEQAVVRLGSTPTSEPPFCAAGQKPCDCIRHIAFEGDADEDEDARCAERTDPPSPVAGFRVFHIERTWHSESSDYLLDEHDQLVALIANEFEYDWGAIWDSQKLDKVDTKTTGGRQVLWIQTTDAYWEPNDVGTSDSTERTVVTLCVRGDASTPTRCPMRDVPIAESHDEDDSKTITTKLDLSIADDGTATLKLLSGPSDEQIAALVGPHKLW